MNYLIEIKLFYDWLETHELSPTAIALWHGLMHTANRSGWKPTITVSFAVLEVRTGISRSTLFRERKKLEKAGLLELIHGKGRARCSYSLRSLEQQLVCHIETQTVETNSKQEGSTAFNPQLVFQNGTQNETQTGENKLS